MPPRNDSLEEIVEDALTPPASGMQTGEKLSILKFMEEHAYALSPTQVAAYAAMERLNERAGPKMYEPYLKAFDRMRIYLSPTGVFMDVIRMVTQENRKVEEPRKKGLFGRD